MAEGSGFIGVGSGPQNRCSNARNLRGKISPRRIPCRAQEVRDGVTSPMASPVGPTGQRERREMKKKKRAALLGWATGSAAARAVERKRGRSGLGPGGAGALLLCFFFLFCVISFLFRFMKQNITFYLNVQKTSYKILWFCKNIIFPIKLFVCCFNNVRIYIFK